MNHERPKWRRNRTVRFWANSRIGALITFRTARCCLGWPECWGKLSEVSPFPLVLRYPTCSLVNMRLNVGRHGCLLAIASIIAIFLLIGGPVNWWQRYQSWSHLSKEKLIASANWYVENRAPGNSACIFAVECKDGRARLKLIKSNNEWDFEASKQIAWDRKFKDICQGQTANFALEIATDNPQSQKTYDGSRRAVWSFYDDQFVPTHTRFGFAAFSEIETEPCLTAYAITTRPRSSDNP